ncbi:unnamed protein product [Pleuronectes platessa]|uniref:Uncharacterized protein n=1 Tax=Pleuronectes platessa TaxID=8262 RepID=A0A9N7YQY3_PLEPL|nr:unnamed protein product [Pleuronectes platessa]
MERQRGRREESCMDRREQEVTLGHVLVGALNPGGCSYTRLFVVFALHREAGYFPELGRRISVAWPPSPAAHMTGTVGKPPKMAQKELAAPEEKYYQALTQHKPTIGLKWTSMGDFVKGHFGMQMTKTAIKPPTFLLEDIHSTTSATAGGGTIIQTSNEGSSSRGEWCSYLQESPETYNSSDSHKIQAHKNPASFPAAPLLITQGVFLNQCTHDDISSQQ